MSGRHFMKAVVGFVLSVSYPILASTTAYTIKAGADQLEFVPQPQKGYVVKLTETAGGLHALAGLSAWDAEDARPMGGLDRRGVWTVENDGPSDRNEETIHSLRAGGRVAYAAPLFSSNGETVAVIPEIVVRVRPGTAIEKVQTLCQAAGCTIRKRMEFTTQEYQLEVLGANAEAVFTAVAQLGQAPDVEWACPNTAFRPRLPALALPLDAAPPEELQIAAVGQDPNTPGVFPNDPYFPMQWHLHNTGQSGGTPGVDIRAPEAWEITTGDPNIAIAEFAGYLDTNHEDLVNNIVPGRDFVQLDSTPVYDYFWAGHGTYCAGIIAAQGNNGIGVAGVTWNCKIMPVRIWSDNAQGHTFITGSEIAAAIRWAAVNGADVMDHQWGWTSPQPAMQSALADATKPGGIGRDGKGCVVVFCNGWNGRAWYPGWYPEAICVDSVDHDGILVSDGYPGAHVDIVAPDFFQTLDEWARSKGRGGLWTTDVTGLPGVSAYPELHPDPSTLDYSVNDGATSIVSGVAALILSIEPSLTSDEVRHFLERSAKDLGDPGRDDYYGWGRVDARAALDMVLAKRADLNNDWKVDEADRVILVKAMEAKDRSADIAPAKKRDGVVDAKDLELLIRYLGTVIPEMGLVAHWKLDEKGGTTAYDSAGKSNAVVIGPAGWQPQGGKVGGALQLSGVANFAMTGFVLNPANPPFSVFAWVKGGAPGQVILAQAGGVNWLLAQPGTGFLMSDLKVHPLLASVVSQTVITDGAWHRVGFVWDGANRILYVDGVEVARDTQASLPSATGGLYLGAGSTPAPGTSWKGLLDDVRVYDRAMKP